MELLDQAPQFPQDTRDGFLQDDMGSVNHSYSTLGLLWSSRPSLCVASLPSSPRFLPYTLPRNAIVPDDLTAGRGPAHLIENIVLRRPRRGWGCRADGHHQAHLDPRGSDQRPIDSSLQYAPSHLHQDQTVLLQMPSILEQPRLSIHGTTGLDEVFSTRKPLQTHIPKGTEEAWARCLLAALSGVN